MTAPTDRHRAWRLQEIAVDGFWCSTAAGGCGNQLFLTAGTKVPPYFRHGQGQAPDCVSYRELPQLQQGYLHLAIQLQLQQWLTAQGYEATLEHRFTDNSRADLHVTAPAGRSAEDGELRDEVRDNAGAHGAERGGAGRDVDAQKARGLGPSDVYMRWSVRDPDAGLLADLIQLVEVDAQANTDSGAAAATQTLEVQLSPIPWAQLRERDARYRRHTAGVTWLFGKNAESVSARTRDEQGVSFGVWPRWSQDQTGGEELFTEQPRQPERDVGLNGPLATGGAGGGGEVVDGKLVADRDGVTVYIGTRRPSRTDWVPLSQCRLDSDGLWTPTRDQALTEHAAAAQEREAGERRAALAAAEVAREKEASVAQRERVRRAVLERSQERENLLRRGAWPVRSVPTEMFEGFAQRFTQASDFQVPGNGRWLAQLPESLQEPARVTVYRVSVLIASGPVSQLRFRDVADVEDRIVRALQDNGFIIVSDGRWRRGPLSGIRAGETPGSC